MARYVSNIEIHGSIGGQTYFTNGYGKQVKEKGSPSAHAMKHGANFLNTRRNAAEFGRAAAASKLFRQAMGPVLAGVNNQRLSSRMVGWLHDVIMGDRIHDKGERTMSAGDFSGLAGFEFHVDRELDDVLPFNTANHLSREAGKVKIDIPAFRLRKKKSIPVEATHYRLVSCLLTIDFDKRRFVRDIQEGPLCVMGRAAGAGFCVEQEIPPVDEQGCFWLVGIAFYQLVGETVKLVKGGAMRVVEWIGEGNEASRLEGNEVEMMVTEIEKGPKPLVIDAAGHGRQGLAAGADHEDAAFVLPFKGRLPRRAHNENGALLNAHHRAGSGSDEVILHNKTIKNEKITAKAACSIQCGMSARPKRKRNKCADYISRSSLPKLVRDVRMLIGTEALCRTVFGGWWAGERQRGNKAMGNEGESCFMVLRM
ncbi:hypothetical protein D3H65_10675 [Paraflavitalea soli]|uniref:Uncharacterized protein n=1 Tax=Paraflavitalea soli TaxID=2315862 RepID=A0A3B7MVF6_9BACT|nr:hypothetical protein [Paraflavitalea soli]AXY74411.1 hypothetical protein D3H65_10675 [Paraflavitalea soli]